MEHTCEIRIYGNNKTSREKAVFRPEASLDFMRPLVEEAGGRIRLEGFAGGEREGGLSCPLSDEAVRLLLEYYPAPAADADESGGARRLDSLPHVRALVRRIFGRALKELPLRIYSAAEPEVLRAVKAKLKAEAGYIARLKDGGSVVLPASAAEQRYSFTPGEDGREARETAGFAAEASFGEEEAACLWPSGRVVKAVEIDGAEPLRLVFADGEAGFAEACSLGAGALDARNRGRRAALVREEAARAVEKGLAEGVVVRPEDLSAAVERELGAAREAPERAPGLLSRLESRAGAGTPLFAGGSYSQASGKRFSHGGSIGHTAFSRGRGGKPAARLLLDSSPLPASYDQDVDPEALPAVTFISPRRAAEYFSNGSLIGRPGNRPKLAFGERVHGISKVMGPTVGPCGTGLDGKPLRLGYDEVSTDLFRLVPGPNGRFYNSLAYGLDFLNVPRLGKYTGVKTSFIGLAPDSRIRRFAVPCTPGLFGRMLDPIENIVGYLSYYSEKCREMAQYGARLRTPYYLPSLEAYIDVVIPALQSVSCKKTPNLARYLMQLCSGELYKPWYDETAKKKEAAEAALPALRESIKSALTSLSYYPMLDAPEGAPGDPWSLKEKLSEMAYVSRLAATPAGGAAEEADAAGTGNAGEKIWGWEGAEAGGGAAAAEAVPGDWDGGRGADPSDLETAYIKQTGGVAGENELISDKFRLAAEMMKWRAGGRGWLVEEPSAFGAPPGLQGDAPAADAFADCDPVKYYILGDCTKSYHNTLTAINAGLYVPTGVEAYSDFANCARAGYDYTGSRLTDTVSRLPDEYRLRAVDSAVSAACLAPRRTQAPAR